MSTVHTPAPRVIVLWLSFIAALIAIMVTVGGATRLTDSGLSITEWDLVSGALPPLSDAAWEAALEEYRQTSEYQWVNRGMSMAEFKEIFWWEWGHRQLGRFIGLAFLVPLAWFSVRGSVRGGLRLRLWGLFGLICLQGVIGWLMVMSGLSGRVDVSQYKLALHLGTAFILFGLIIWQILAMRSPSGTRAASPGLATFGRLLLGATFVQIILGAFVAGLRAGKTYTTWPLMDGQFVPEGYFRTPAQWTDLFETIEAVQFNHRLGAYIVFALAVAFAWRCWRANPATRRVGTLVLSAVSAQALLGIWTLVAAVPLWLGLAHQAGALGVLAVMVWANYVLTPRHPKASSAESAAH